MTADQISGPLAALLAGLVTSLHCVGMCGPISCGVCLRGGVRRSLPAVGVYHGARVISYTVVGLLAGGLGAVGAGRFFRPVQDVTPWILLGFLAFMAAGWDRKLLSGAFRARPVAGLVARCGRTGGTTGAGLLGAVTPFLPCGPLYLMVGVALLSGSVWRGGSLLAAFAVGVIPFYLAVQIGFVRFGARLNAAELEKTRRWLAGISVVIVAARMIQPMVTDRACVICQ